jgi:hypothetical protein
MLNVQNYFKNLKINKIRLKSSKIGKITKNHDFNTNFTILRKTYTALQ